MNEQRNYKTIYQFVYLALTKCSFVWFLEEYKFENKIYLSSSSLELFYYKIYMMMIVACCALFSLGRYFLHFCFLLALLLYGFCFSYGIVYLFGVHFSPRFLWWLSAVIKVFKLNISLWINNKIYGNSWCTITQIFVYHVYIMAGIVVW